MRKKNTRPKIKYETHPLTIASIGANGDGVAHYDGKSVFIPKTMDGDRIIAKIPAPIKDGAQGQCIEITIPSAQRSVPACPHFEQCGGCDLQHLGQDAYRAWKIEKIKTAFSRAHLTPEEWKDPVFIAQHTRRRATFALIKTDDKNLTLGFHAPRSHNIITIKQCTILKPVILELIEKLHPLLLRLAPLRQAVDITVQYIGVFDILLGGPWFHENGPTLAQNEILSEILHIDTIARISHRANDLSPTEILLQKSCVYKSFGDLNVALPPCTFLQASNEGEAALCEAVIAHARNAKTIADLFCGAGTFTGHLLKAGGANVFAADSEGPAINALKQTNHPYLRTEKRNLFKDPINVKDLNKFDVILFDPPRAGAKAQSEEIARSSCPRIIGVSCNPASFIRDAKTLIAGGYTIKSVQIIDQFVWSAHTELVTLFIK